MSARTVEIAHVGGATHDLRIDLPVGRITVLHGDNEVGKSSTLDALRALLTGQGSLDVSRGHAAGYVRGFDAEVRVTAHKTTRNGDPTARIIAGGDPRRFIAPKGESPEVRDAERLRLLVRLTGTEITEQAWVDALFGGDDEAYRAAAKSDTIGERDPLEKARKLKRDLDALARDQEARAERERARASGIRQTIGDIDLAMPHDEAALAANYTARARVVADLEADRKAALERKAAFAAAREALEHAADLRGGQSSAVAQESLDAIEAEFEALGEAERLAMQRVRDAEVALAQARGAHDLAKQATRDGMVRVERARAEVASAKAAEASLASARRVVEAGEGPGGPSDERLAEVRAAADLARRGVQYGAQVRLALAKAAEADDAAEIASGHDERARVLREKARATEGVLADAIGSIAPAGLRISDGRLWLRRGEADELVDDLSDGARSSLCLRIQADAAGPGGVVVFDQGYWESIGPSRRAELAASVAALNVSVLTAECARGGELRAATYEPRVNGAASHQAGSGDAFAFEE